MRIKNNEGKFIINLDFDGVITNSILAVVELYKIINSELIQEEIIPIPVYEDVEKWNFQPILDWTNEQIELAFEQELFFDLLPFECGKVISTRMIIDMLLERNDVDLRIVTKGTKRNLELKKKFISKHFPNFDINNLIGIPLTEKGKPNLDGLLLIDDCDSNFNGNCKYNILYVKNNQVKEWNMNGINNPELYKIFKVEQMYDVILDFIDFEKLR